MEAFKIDEWEISSDTRTIRGVDDGIRIATIKMPGQKVFLAQPMNSKNDHLSQDRLRNELYLTRLLRNKNLLTAVAVFIDPCSFEISLAFDESIADQSLYGMLYYSKRVLVFDQILSIMAQIGNGVEFMHERQLFHNAISSSNIFLCEGGHNAKLGNFQRATKAELTKLINFEWHFGKNFAQKYSHWLAPEVLDDFCAVSRESDIFSLGIVFVELTAARNQTVCSSQTFDVQKFVTDRQMRLKTEISSIKRIELRKILKQLTNFDAEQRARAILSQIVAELAKITGQCQTQVYSLEKLRRNSCDVPLSRQKSASSIENYQTEDNLISQTNFDDQKTSNLDENHDNNSNENSYNDLRLKKSQSFSEFDQKNIDQHYSLDSGVKKLIKKSCNEIIVKKTKQIRFQRQSKKIRTKGKNFE